MQGMVRSEQSLEGYHPSLHEQAILVLHRWQVRLDANALSEMQRSGTVVLSDYHYVT